MQGRTQPDLDHHEVSEAFLSEPTARSEAQFLDSREELLQAVYTIRFLSIDLSETVSVSSCLSTDVCVLPRGILPICMDNRVSNEGATTVQSLPGTVTVAAGQYHSLPGARISEGRRMSQIVNKQEAVNGVMHNTPYVSPKRLLQN